MNPGPPGPRQFFTTRWSNVLQAGDGTESGREALEVLCAAYWPPLYAFARRQGQDLHAAQDLVQGFFTDLLDRGSVRDADPERGRFRTFLLAAFKHYASKERERAGAQKRGGGKEPISLDFAREQAGESLDPVDELTPEKLYERHWALTLLERVLDRLRREQTDKGRAAFEALSGHLLGDGPGVPYAEVAERLGMSQGAVKVTVHRLRRRYREALRDEISQTVGSEEEVDAEIRDLMAALG